MPGAQISVGTASEGNDVFPLTRLCLVLKSLGLHAYTYCHPDSLSDLPCLYNGIWPKLVDCSLDSQLLKL